MIQMSEIQTLKDALQVIDKLRKELKEAKDLSNGSNLIVLDEQERILVVREKTRKRLWMLPGGGIDRGESPRHASQSETEEEAGLITDESNFRLIGHFVQRPKGVVFLYETRQYSGELSLTENDEVSETRFMSFEEIIERQEEFRTGYLRMILRYKRCILGIDKIPYEGRLSDPVEFPKNLDGGNYRDIVLLV